jgi:hypothetical protein
LGCACQPSCNRAGAAERNNFNKPSIVGLVRVLIFDLLQMNL